MNYSDNLSIQLTIGSKTYPIEIERKYEQIYREAAQLINTKIHNYINIFPEQEKEDYMAMTLIDIAVKLIKETDVDNRLGELINSIDEALHLDEKIK